MVRTQIQLTERQALRLRQLAQRRGVSIAALIREAVDLYAGDDDFEARKRRALTAVGRFRDREGASDVGVNHDKYLDEAYGDWRR